jgi:NADPH:quinone reductase-like Zn-dependent oxidoreductase
LSIATDYRDFRKSGFQEYAVVDSFNAVRLLDDVNPPRAAAVGVAFVAAALSLGVCLGMTLYHKRGLNVDLLNLARAQDRVEVPEDVADEVFDALGTRDRAVAGDWVLIYGGTFLMSPQPQRTLILPEASTITGQTAIQLAKWSGMRVVVVTNKSKHAQILQELGAGA